MAQTNGCPRRALSFAWAINMSFTCSVAQGGWWWWWGGGRRPSEGPGGGIKLTNHWGSAISTGNTLAINTNSLLRRTPWPINASDAETGSSDELSLTPLLGLMGQKGTRRASVCIPLKKWLKWPLQWPDTYLIRAPCRHITLSYRQSRGGRGREDGASGIQEHPIFVFAKRESFRVKCI